MPDAGMAKAYTLALQAGIGAVPTVIIGRRRLQGLYPAAALREIIEQESSTS